jgi:hypothetical protein
MTIYGTLMANGSLRVGGDAEFNGNTVFNRLVAFMDKVIFKQDVQFEGRATFNKDAAGFAVLHVTENRIHITFAQEYATVPVINVSVGNGVFAQYSYENVTTTGFDIVLAAPATQDIEFSWIALSVKDAVTSGVQP